MKKCGDGGEKEFYWGLGIRIFVMEFERVLRACFVYC
jgi:hypothetical protein